jgi:hypothetical protein
MKCIGANTSRYLKFVSLIICGAVISAFQSTDSAPETKKPFPGADETSPSRAQYFSWINNTNEGATEAQTLTNLEFFDWLHREYGMQLDIYAFDAGAIDSKRWYGSTESEKFKQQFPNGFDTIYEKASSMGLRLGIWGGPDGFGDTPEEEAGRTNMMVNLCDRYDFALFKFDTVAGNLRDDKQAAFSKMMTACRKFSPDLILLNHRINLGETAKDHATTFLWEGQETYIDVHLANTVPAPHHRAGALARGLPPKLQRLTEDHGVCLSSALDYWDDELILQAFNRSLILSPQIYCNPWLLSDSEFPKLARIFNLARDHRHLLTKGIVLPEKTYGPSAVSRGDGGTRLVTLRNLSWQSKTYEIVLSDEIGLEATPERIEVRKYHPNERVFGTFQYGERVKVTVPPFRSTLLKISTDAELGLTGVDYNVIRDVPGRPVEIELVSVPGQSATLGLVGNDNRSTLSIDGNSIDSATLAGGVPVEFEGDGYRQAFNRKLGDMVRTEVPDDAEALYEASVYSADNNALEVRSLERSGHTKYAAVKAARDAFFDQKLFTERAIWDRNLFDDDPTTAFAVMDRWRYWWNNDPDTRVNDGGFRLDFGAIENIDKIVLLSRDELSLSPAKVGEGVIAEVSTDLESWTEVRFVAGKKMTVKMPHDNFPVRYFRIKVDAPSLLSEVNAYKDNNALGRSKWRASNLFGAFERMEFVNAWTLEAELSEIAPNSYLSVAIPGYTGNEGVYAALRVDGELIGAPDRAPSYPANTWELQVKPVNGNYTYYIPLRREWVNKTLEIVVLGTEEARATEPFVWLNRRVLSALSKELAVGQD